MQPADQVMRTTVSERKSALDFYPLFFLDDGDGGGGGG